MTNAIVRSKSRDVLRWNKKKRHIKKENTSCEVGSNEETKRIGGSIFVLLTAKMKNPKSHLQASKPRYRQDWYQE